LREATLYVIDEAITESRPAPSQPLNRSAPVSFFFVLLFTFAIYARPEDILPSIGQFHVTFILGLCAGLSYLGSYLLGNAPLVWTRELRIVLFLTACFVAGVPFAYWRGGAFQVLTETWLKTLTIFFLLTQTLVTLGRLRKILWAIILSELLVCAYSVVQSSHLIWIGQRLLGVSQDILGWNFLGLSAAVTIPYIAAIYIAQPGFLRTSVLISSLLFLMWMLVLTASRGGLLNVLFSVALTWLIVLRGNSRAKTIGIGIVAVLLVAISLAPPVFWERMSTVWSGAQGSQSEVAAAARMSQEERLGLLRRAIHYTFQNPVVGLGLGNFAVASGTELGRPEDWLGTHNTFVEISSEAGIPALVLFVSLLWTAIRRMQALSRTLAGSPETWELKLMARATSVSLLSFVFGAFFAHLGYGCFLYYPVAMAVGVQRIAHSIQEPSFSLALPVTDDLQPSATNWGP